MTDTPIRTPSASSVRAPKASSRPAGAKAPAETEAPAGVTPPSITVDANAPTDPVIRTETEALRADAAGSPPVAPAGVAAGGASPHEVDQLKAEDAKTAEAPKVADAPVTRLGEQARLVGSDVPPPTFPNYHSSRPVFDLPGQAAAPLPPFSRATEAGAIAVRIEGVAGRFVEVSGLGELRKGAPYLLYFFDRLGVERVALIRQNSIPNLIELRYDTPRPLVYSDALVINDHAEAGLEEFLQDGFAPAPTTVAPITAAAAGVADEVMPAAPTPQPTAVVDPAFLRVTASAIVTKVSGSILVLNTEARAEPEHFYGLRYVDINGVPRIRRLEAFVGPTDSFVMAGDIAPPMVGSDVQLGVLSASIDTETGAPVLPGGYLALRPHGDGTATAVTIDGRKIKVGLV